MLYSKLLIPLLMTLGADSATTQETYKLEQLRWLSGTWAGKQGTTETEEHWLPPKGGIMLGVNRSVQGPGKSSFEFLRIAAEKGRIVYYASPGGQKPTPFVLKKLSGTAAMFENQKNDFPQRIIYKRAGGQMEARIEGLIDGKQQAMSWKWSQKSPRRGRSH